MLQYKFDIIGITETKIKKGVKSKISLEIDGYKYYHTDTEAEKGGTLIYISNTINSKQRTDLEALIYKPEILESTVLEIINPKKKNILVSCIYRHPSMDLKEFNEEYLAPFMEITEKEKKKTLHYW
jgi:exonuclease III